ncbi:LPS export ABC transporter periplasmic protein LptC [Halorhodospira abdelmalekii]|uniref:LPS export ABC transporter periplasmic protein LptC n=1 Tax=Halorhodospira abdelmalekii TaxID=421629 RepID=UPI0019052616|nr:LPS export ABC transporter periplasmic protein LptC [Halorhodospira abdelmalekii]MBK1734086.1 LPS export ABC transporter periplasmic protein LptC [Halorhodospira abdelmalekii]
MATRGVLFPLAVVAVSALVGVLLSYDAPDEEPLERPEEERPDFFVEGFAMHHYDESGVQRSLLRGVSGEHYPQRREMEIVEPNWYGLSQGGAVWQATAPLGTASHEQRTVWLHDAVTLLRPAQPDRPMLTVETRDLFIDTEQGIAQTEATIVAYDPFSKVRGRGMTLEYLHDRLRLHEEVRGHHAAQ